MKQADSRKLTGQLRHILSGHKPERVELIRILQEAEGEFGYLPREAMLETANFTRIPAASVYGTATFYNRFRFTPLGRHPVKACMGTACHMAGGALVLDALERELGTKVGDITHDGEFSLDRVACIGCCFLAPPDLPRQILLEGHGIGLHAYEHTRLAFRGRAMIQDQLSRTKAAIQQATGYDARLFRPPYGFFEPSLLKLVGQLGLSAVMWDIDPGDSVEKDPQVVVKRIARRVRPGSIILLHDNKNTRDRVDAVLLGVRNALNDRSLKVEQLQL